jgi:hypothetical protein
MQQCEPALLRNVDSASAATKKNARQRALYRNTRGLQLHKSDLPALQFSALSVWYFDYYSQPSVRAFYSPCIQFRFNYMHSIHNISLSISRLSAITYLFLGDAYHPDGDICRGSLTGKSPYFVPLVFEIEQAESRPETETERLLPTTTSPLSSLSFLFAIRKDKRAGSYGALSGFAARAANELFSSKSNFENIDAWDCVSDGVSVGCNKRCGIQRCNSYSFLKK